MYLKSLTLKGFKSFADKTPLVFEDGLNVVVGPNGSGKSNVADAILWVLGEQSAKLLRGQAMEDVIFSGSAERKSVSVAEVTLSLSNEDHTLPLDFSEIAITRRMYRTGESEYFINGAPSRLLDITDILHDSGLGRETSSIISQGKLDAVLSNRPEERRELVEEAAGIAKHRRRKKRAERKLARMDEHVARAKIINRELKRRLRPLEEQVGKAQAFKDLEEERIQLATECAVDDVRRLHHEYGELMTKKQEVEAQVSLLGFEEKEKQKHLQKLQSMLEARGLYVGDLGEQRRRVTGLEARMDSNIALLMEKERSLSERILGVTAQIRDIKEQLKSNEERLSDFKRELKEAEEAKRKAQAATAAYKPKSDEIQKRIALAETKRKQDLDEQTKVNRHYDEVLLAHTKLEHTLESQKLQGGIWVDRIASLDKEITTLAEETATAQKDMESKEKERASVQENGAKYSKILEGTKEELQNTQEAFVSLQNTLFSQIAERNALQDQLETMGEEEEPKALKAARDSKNLLSRIGSYIAFPQELEAITEKLLGQSIEASIVATPEALRKLALDVTQEKSAFTDSFLAINETEETASPNISGAESYVSTFKRLREEEVPPTAQELALVSRLFSKVYLTKSATDALDLAQKHPEQTFAAYDGLIACSNGVVIVGTNTENEGSRLAQSRRLRELNRSVPENEKQLEKLQSSIDGLSQKKDDYAAQADEAQSSLLRLTSELESARVNLEHAQRRIEELQQEKATIESSQKKALDEVAESQKALQEYARQLKEDEARKQTLDDAIAKQRADIEDMRKSEIDYLKALNEAELSLNAATAHLERLQKEDESLLFFKENAAQNIQKLERLRALVTLQKERVQPLKNHLQHLLTIIQALVAKLQDSASVAVSDSAELRETIAKARKEAEEAREKANKAVLEQNRIEIEEGKIEVRVGAAVETLKDVASMSVDEALLLAPLEDREEKEGRLAQVKSELAALGPVNQVALAEYDDLKERAAFYANQLEDLKLARRALAKITKAIDARMHGAFEQTFNQVNQHFQDTFNLFFPGGKAHLELTDPDNLEETGIEIIAQPKGKRIPKIALMSGGEKSLTALAFLFAIYQTHTVPFYVFDEVEAALDDANLDKFIDAIDMLKETTQLIVISHQRRTMEAADVLYGVSMQADGISKVVSQKLDEYEKKFLEA